MASWLKLVMYQNGDMEEGLQYQVQPAQEDLNMPNLPAEFSKLPHARGTIGAARSAKP